MTKAAAMPRERIYEVMEKQRDRAESVIGEEMEDFKVQRISLWDIPK
jgi:hypothetical protein